MAITTFIPKLWSARLLYALEKSHVATNLVNRNYEGQISNQGDTVHINSIGAVTVKDYVKNTDMDAPETLATTDQTLVIDQAKAFNFQVDDVDRVQAAGELIDTAMGRAAYALADVSDAYLLSVIAAGADSGNVIGAASGPIALTAANVYENIVKLRTKLDKANVPTSGRSIVIPPDVYALLLNDTTHFSLAQAVTKDNVVINGMVGRIAGFDVYMSNNIKTGTGTDGGHTPYFEVTAQIPDACTFAEQIVKTEAYRMEKRFADGVKGLHVYGAKVTSGKAIAKLICSVS